ncbi:uncharacterized protein H6S33_009509 [Morchella sextelata]|uniref:uncharacterized protein n=1 Tax=Morchella sextelata TaxID=1174677 RepID=UPI001D054FBC|nr:uncharacterized protein H6S33_009509 [Morchella sextelata]KAH0613129.1 hypothetical protein H6S33_009509 [Morchella sextelata]
MVAFVIIILSYASLIAGAPSVSFPINSQVPPVARVSEAFEFVFSPWTFTSSVKPISYNITNGPSWLMLDSNSRSLYGTPKQDNIGSFEVVITATDQTGSTSHPAILVVSSEPGPMIEKDIDSQLKNAGMRDGKGGIVFFPGQPYEFSFLKDTFGPPGSVKQYEAVSTGNTPLPSWINFDQGRLKFSGVTPDLTSLIAPPQSFDVTLIATDYPGFAGPSVSFQMVVGPHRIYFKDTLFTANATSGDLFNYKVPRNAILLDSEPIGLENLSSLSVTGSDWLSFDADTFLLSGTPPKGTESTTVNLVAHDVFGGEAQAKLQISVTSTNTTDVIFKGGIPDFNTTGGENFVYSIDRKSLSTKNVKLSVKYNPDVDWISFDAENLRFEGTAPKESIRVQVIMSAQAIGKPSESRSFSLNVDGDANVESVSATPTSMSTGTTTSQTEAKATSSSVTRTGTPKAKPPKGKADTNSEASTKRSRKRTLIIVLATVLPLIVVCSFLFIWYFATRRSTDSNSYYSRSTTPIGSEISRPFVQLPQPWAVTSSNQKELETPRRLSAFGYFTTDGSGRISNGFMSSMMSNDGTILRLPSPPIHTALIPSAPETPGDSGTVGAINFSQHPVNRISFPTGPLYSLYPAVGRSNSRGKGTHPAIARSNSRRENIAPGNHRTGSGGSSSRPWGANSHALRRRSSTSVKGNNVGHGKSSFGGPPGYGVPKRSWKRTVVSPSRWPGGKRFRESEETFETVSTEIFNQVPQVSQKNEVDQPSVRLVDGSPEGAEKASQVRARGSSPFFAGSSTAWRRGSKVHSSTGAESNDGDQDVIDDVIKTMIRENSYTKTIGTYSSLNLPETPLRRYNSALPSHFAASSSFMNHPSRGLTAEEDGAFSNVVDESGQRVWYPKHSTRESGVTSYSRGGSSYYPYEPFEYGVAVTSTRAQGPAMGRPSTEEERPTRIVGEMPIPPLVTQRAKLVDFTKKRPVGISEEGSEEEIKGSFPVDMTYL